MKTLVIALGLLLASVAQAAGFLDGPQSTFVAPPTDPQFAKVKMLVANDNAASGTTTFVDQSSFARTITRGGTAVYSNAQAPVGMSTSVLLAGGNFLSAASSADFAYGSADWTIEFYIYLNATSGSPNLFDQRTGGADGANQAVVYVNGTPAPIYYLAGDKITGTTITTGGWHHYALCRVSGSTREFWDGTQMGSTYTDANSYVTAPFFLGISGDGGSNPTNAYYAGLRVTAGNSGGGRYSTTFTPGTLPWPNQ